MVKYNQVKEIEKPVATDQSIHRLFPKPLKK